MAYYIARVELRGNPSVEAYSRLHRLMERNGFSQTIEGADAEQYVQEALPYATFAGNSELDPTTLRNLLANQIMPEIQPQIALLVAHIVGWSMYRR